MSNYFRWRGPNTYAALFYAAAELERTGCYQAAADAWERALPLSESEFDAWRAIRRRDFCWRQLERKNP